MNLPLGTCICRAAVTVKPTLIADADTAQVVSLCVRANPLNRTGRLYIPILADKMKRIFNKLLMNFAPEF